LVSATVPLDEIYRDVVLDHYRSPRGRKELASPDARAEGKNPLCGDELTLQLNLEGDRIKDVSVQAHGCSISVASGSMLAELLPGKTLEEAQQVMAAFKALMHGEPLPEGLDIGDLDALQGVSKFPVRVKCALLAWTTLQDALGLGPNRSDQKNGIQT
jgi:nitrogen fixation NifU-like protein